MRHQPPAWVDSYVGIEWKDEGRTRADGVDCWGLGMILFQEQRGISLPTLIGKPAWKSGDSKLPDGGKEKRAAIWRLIEEERKAWRPVTSKPVTLGLEQCFDAMIMEYSGVPIHIGWIVAPGWVLHIQEGCNSICERFPTLRVPLNHIESINRYAA